jgi:hypothetical protein
VTDEELDEKRVEVDRFRQELQSLLNEHRNVLKLSHEFKWTLMIRDNGAFILIPEL